MYSQVRINIWNVLLFLNIIERDELGTLYLGMELNEQKHPGNV